MAVKFEFILEDVDAENLLWAVRNYALRNDEYIFDYIIRTDLTSEQKASYISVLKDSKSYFLDLIGKMSNTRVE